MPIYMVGDAWETRVGRKSQIAFRFNVSQNKMIHTWLATSSTDDITFLHNFLRFLQLLNPCHAKSYINEIFKNSKTIPWKISVSYLHSYRLNEPRPYIFNVMQPDIYLWVGWQRNSNPIFTTTTKLKNTKCTSCKSVKTYLSSTKMKILRVNLFTLSKSTICHLTLLTTREIDDFVLVNDISH